MKKKVLIITGGTKGIGKKIVESFIKKNFYIAFCSSSKCKINSKIKSYSRNFIYKKVDVRNEREVKNFITLIIKKFKKIDYLINNAGIYGDIGNFEYSSMKEWKKAIEVNLFGSVNFIKYCLPHFKKKTKSKIIQLSGGGATGPSPGFSSYGASKAAIVRFVETISIEIKKYNIDINAIAPGPINTGMIDQALFKGKSKLNIEDYNKLLMQKKNGGVGYEHVIKLINYLLSEKANGISGKLISAVWDNFKLLNKFNKNKHGEIFTLRRKTGKDLGISVLDK